MLLDLKNTSKLTNEEFVETLSIHLWDKENIYLIDEDIKADIPNYFYISAYIIEFNTEFQMQGLVTLLSNSPAKNFENTLNSLKIIESSELYKCLTDIKYKLSAFGFTPENVGVIIDDEILIEMRICEKILLKIYPNMLIDLVKYLRKVRK
jgi:hypothetical protein